MDEKTVAIISKFLSGVRIEDMPEKEEAPEGRFPCPRCGGTGWADVYIDGYRMKELCPDCAWRRKKAQILKESGVKPEAYARYTLDSFRTDTETAKRMKDAALQYIAQKPKGRGMGFFGTSGAGKTHICIAVLQELGVPHRLWKYRREIQELKAAMYKDFDRYKVLMDRAKTADNLYIDDMFQGAFADGKLSQQDAQIMFELLDTRCENRLATWFSSNYTLDQIFSANAAIGGRIYELIKPYSITVTGRDRRVVG